MSTQRERMVALEIRVDTMEENFRDMRIKIDEMHNVLMQAKGARWMLIVLCSLGGFAAGIAAKLAPIFGKG